MLIFVLVGGKHMNSAGLFFVFSVLRYLIFLFRKLPGAM